MAGPRVITITVPNDPIEILTLVAPGTQGPTGLPGPKGDPGPADLISMGTVTTTAPGTTATATITGAIPNRKLNLTLPTGPKGDPGTAGAAATLASGTINTGAPGTDVVATVTGTGPNYLLNLTIPRGNPGTNGPANTLSIGTVTSATTPSATLTGTSPNQTLNLVLPKGDKGDKGDQGNTGLTGPANSLAIGTVTTGAVGSSAAASITGTAPSQTLNLTLPRGATGNTGPANSLSIGTVTASAAGSLPAASITGTAPSQALNLVLPTGATGPAGPGVATGGVAGMILQKASSTNFDTSWAIAASAASPSTVVVRDSDGRFRAVTPVDNLDVSNKVYVDTQRDQAVIDGRRAPINALTVNAYALSPVDAGTYLSMNSASAITVTIPADLAVPNGTIFVICQTGAGSLNVSPGTGVTLTSYSGSRVVAGQYGIVTLIKTGDNIYRLTGDIKDDTGVITPVADSYWTPLGGAEAPHYRVKNGIADFNFGANRGANMWGVGQRLFRDPLPTTARPARVHWFMGDWGGVFNEVKVQTDGYVVMGNSNGASGIVVSGSWLVV